MYELVEVTPEGEKYIDTYSSVEEARKKLAVCSTTSTYNYYIRKCNDE